MLQRYFVIHSNDMSWYACPMRAVVLVAITDALSRVHSTQACAATLFRTLEAHFALLSMTVTLGTRAPMSFGAPGRPGRECVVPLVDVHGVDGRIRLLFGGKKSGAEVPSESLLEDLSVVLSGFFRQMQVFERVGAVAHRAHRTSRLLDEQLKAHSLPTTIVAESPTMRRLFGETLPLVARQDISVLITGETGTGKELVARRIHELSSRSKRAFVSVNCGAIPSELVESTLFGHERGAFTGAVKQQLGVFERADSGTLFLDELAELSPQAQVKLLRVLQEREIERVGAASTRPVDVRVVCATHRDLEQRVRAGLFREDLFYRLNVFAVHLPPLRERPTEIAVLARHVLHAVAAKLGVATPTLSRAMVQELQSYTWPGNVRELQNVLERSVLLSAGGEFVLELPKHSRITYRVRTFADASRKAIEDALAVSDGRVYGAGGAAELLALKPTTLASKIKKLRVRVG